MLPVRKDLIGWYDTKLHVTYGAAEAEAKFGARIYRDGQRPAHLYPMFEADTPAEREARWGHATEEDAWIKRFKRWCSLIPQSMSEKSRHWR